MSRSDRQYGCKIRGEERRTEQGQRGQSNEKSEKEDEYTRTYKRSVPGIA